jgi:PAS domain S-box-containing protein
LALSLTLSQKSLLLLIAPLLSEIVMFGTLAYLQNLSEQEANQANHARLVAEDIGHLIKSVYDTYGSVTDNSSGAEFVVVPARQKLDAIVKQFEKLYEMIGQDPLSVSKLKRATESNKEGIKLLEQTRVNYENGQLQEAHFTVRILKLLRKSITQDLIGLSDLQRAIAEKSPERLAEIRSKIRWALLIGGLLTLGLSIQVVFIFSRTVTGRIGRVSQNVSRLARGATLLPPLSGRDEIAQLDQAFHDTVRALEEAIGKERAITENAVDMICSINIGGAFVAVNPSCERLLGFEADELIGLRMLSLVPEADLDSVNKALDECRNLGETTTFEARLTRQDGKIVDTLWSVKWSPQAQNLFCVVHDISDKKEAERIKQEVIAMVSHDLRSPLSTVKVVHESLLKGILGGLTEKGQRMVAMADGNVDRMMMLINDLLLIEKAKSGGLRLRLAETNLQSTFEAAKEAVAGWASEKNIGIEIKPTALSAHADEGRIIQVLSNLLGNAVKFSPANSRVLIQAVVVGDEILVHVQDQAEAIPADLHTSIFERFQQVKSQDSENKSGSGLGLAICKTIVELHGGRIWVESIVNRGNQFSFSLPSLDSQKSKNE